MVFVRLCCFRCSIAATKERVWEIIEKKKPWNICRNKVLMPVLRRLAALGDGRWTPSSWIVEDVGEACPSKNPITARFWSLCRMVQRMPESMDRNFMMQFESLAESVLMRICRATNTTDIWLWTQIKLVKNEDRVLNMVRTVASSRSVKR